MSVVYAQSLHSEAISIQHVQSASSLPLMVGRCRVYLNLELSPLRLPMLHSGSSPPKKCTKTFREKFKHAFKIYSIWPQASTLQTHIRIAVLLVWGSLGLTPSTYTPSINTTYSARLIILSCTSGKLSSTDYICVHTPHIDGISNTPSHMRSHICSTGHTCYTSRLIPRLSRTASDGKLGGAMEQG